MPIRVVSTHLRIKAGRLMAAGAQLLFASLCVGQQPAQAPAPQAQQPEAGTAAKTMLTVPAGTRILMALAPGLYQVHKARRPCLPADDISSHCGR